MSYEIMKSPVEKNIIDDPCYFGEISRKTSEEYLKKRGTREGTYLIRGKENEYRLSVLEVNNEGECDVSHYKIKHDSNGHYSIEDVTVFSTIMGLVNYYKGKFTDMEQPLTEPCPNISSNSETDKDVYANYSQNVDCMMKQFGKNAVKLHSLLVNGPICNIWAGLLTSSDEKVIIKTLNTNEENTNNFLLNEAMAINKLKHRNIVKFHGQSISDPVFLAYEYLPNGNLLEHLLFGEPCRVAERKSRFAQEIALALQYVNGMGFVHRNVRASNVLLSATWTCKLAGFGYAAKLGENKEYKEQKDDKPHFSSDIRWMAPESMQSKTFSIKSDIWSLGGTMFEIFSDGHTPFSDEFSSSLKAKILDGYKPQRPKNMTYTIYYLLLKCWDLNPDIRPTYNDIESLLKEVEPLNVPVQNYSPLNSTPVSTPEKKANQRDASSNLASPSTPEKSSNKKVTKCNGKTLKERLMSKS